MQRSTNDDDDDDDDDGEDDDDEYDDDGDDGRGESLTQVKVVASAEAAWSDSCGFNEAMPSG